MIKIDKGIPIPRHRKGPKPKYPFAQMSIGDSFFAAASANTLSSSSYQHTTRIGGKFSMRATVEDGVTGYRVWRIE
jgi:hypothetical protein